MLWVPLPKGAVASVVFIETEELIPIHALRMKSTRDEIHLRHIRPCSENIKRSSPWIYLLAYCPISAWCTHDILLWWNNLFQRSCKSKGFLLECCTSTERRSQQLQPKVKFQGTWPFTTGWCLFQRASLRSNWPGWTLDSGTWTALRNRHSSRLSMRHILDRNQIFNDVPVNRLWFCKSSQALHITHMVWDWAFLSHMRSSAACMHNALKLDDYDAWTVNECGKYADMSLYAHLSNSHGCHAVQALWLPCCHLQQAKLSHWMHWELLPGGSTDSHTMNVAVRQGKFAHRSYLDNS